MSKLKPRKYTFVDDHYPFFKKFIQDMIPYVTCEKDYTLSDYRILDVAQWFNQRGYYCLEGFCDPTNMVLPKYITFFQQHFKNMELEDVRDLELIGYEVEGKIICAAFVKFLK